MLLPWLMATRVAFAGWEFTPPGDPNRNWTARVTSGGSYDDNFFGTENNRQAGFRFNADLMLRASVPIERLFMGLTYDYAVQYPRDLYLGGVNESHNVNFSANYTFSPRLTLSLNENYVSSIQPELAQTQAGVPITVVQAGDYVYDNVVGNLNYALTPRWNLVLNGNWTLSALYMLDQRTTAGINYQYGQNLFTNPGTNNALNAQWQTVYLSVVRRFNPRLSLQLNGGYTIRESEDGSMSTAPSGYASLAYNYGPDSAISLILGHTLTEGSTAGFGFTRQFNASENTTVAFQINHRLTARLRTMVDASYAFSTFLIPVSVSSLSGQDESLTGHIGVNYAFRDWLSVALDYHYTRYSQSISGMPGIPNFTFDRNQVSLGLSLTY
jgi:opacity protein-like surface antigen